MRRKAPHGRSGPRPGARRPERPARPPVADPARDAAFAHLAAQARRYPDLEIGGLDDRELDARDAAFAHAIVDHAVRRWLTILHLIEGSSTRPWELIDARVKGALLGGAAQLLFMDRTPAHAAVGAAVTWTNNKMGRGAGGFVNATLRAVASAVASDSEGWPETREKWTDQRDELPLADGRALALTRQAMPKDPLQRLSVATSHPLELLRAWTKSFPLHEVRRLAHHGVARPPVILNTAHMADRSALEGLAVPHEAPGHHVFTGTRPQLETLIRSRRDVWVQDPASSLAVESVADLRPSLIVDACAGRGTKTRQLALTFPDARIVATDVSHERSADLRAAFEGHERVTVVPYESLGEHAGRADLVLLDMPCSNTGVLARRVEARYRFGRESVASLTATQRQILADSIRLITPPDSARPRGAILYSTCSLEEEENEEMLRWAERWHSLRSSRQSRRAPAGGPGLSPERYTDGSFAALLA